MTASAISKQVRAWAPGVLGGIRLINGAGALLAPGFAARRLGVDPNANAAPIYPLRMFGVRTVVIGAELLLPRSEEQRAWTLRVGIVIHASDTIAAALAGLRGHLPARTALLLTGVSALNTTLAVVGSQSVRG